jgi:ribonuclease E
MANKMLIDASHPEETRVVVLRGNRVEEFDFEAANRKQLRGNIYLAKVTRVEPSLQAAFIEYGGNRHGFLAFSEIHPDYYQIPVADRLALLEEEARSHRDEDDEEDKKRRSRRRGRNEKRARPDASVSEAAPDTDAVPPETIEGEIVSRGDDQLVPVRSLDLAISDIQLTMADPASAHHHEMLASDSDVTVEADDEPAPAQTDGTPALAAGEDDDDHDSGEDDEEEHVEHIGGDAMEDVPNRYQRLRRQYKIQEVIKRRQVLLVQVVKEERGNKGAALTTYLSLAGRYSVLMPNTARGGGISRKITDAADRKRLKAIAGELEVPEGMGVILRTAGAARTKPEIRRDFEYLLRMWETVRELTLKSSAACLVYEEGSLIKRAIRDLYNKDIDEVIVSGEDGYREAKDFMRMLMPSHAKNVQAHRELKPIFAKAGAEAQLDAMFSNVVTLKSGGYIVINQTEALVAIDVNSGRSTREHNIEDTALRTNLEAADEVARQLRLRDLAGLIVVDFIDMEEGRNNRAVERRVKDALKNDRARIQIGRISHFGLLEMSRQRIRTGVLEGSTIVCPHCAGAGMVRGTASIALHVMRVLEDALIKNAMHNIIVRSRTQVALYILNQKRAHLRALEERFGVQISVEADDTLTGMTYHALERGELASPPPVFERKDLVRIDSVPIADEEIEDEIEDEDDEEEVAAPVARESGERRQRSEGRGEGRGAGRPEARVETKVEGEDDSESGRRRRRRRRRGRGASTITDPNSPQPSDDGLLVMAEIGGDIARAPERMLSDGEVDTNEVENFELEPGQPGESEGEGLRRRRRSRRGGRNRRRDDAPRGERQPQGEFVEGAEPAAAHSVAVEQPAPPVEAPVEAPARRETPVAPAWDWAPMANADVTPPPARVEAPAPAPAPVADSAPEPMTSVAPPAPIAVAVAPEPTTPKTEPLSEAPVGPKRTGWWARAKPPVDKS